MIISIAVNVGLLIWVASAHRKLKHDVLISLLFGTVKAGLVFVFSTGAIAQVGILPVAIGALIRGLFSFLTCWGFMALLGRTDRLELDHRRAVASGEHRKKPAMVLEYIGLAVCGILCALS
jgi:hypothetical protein